MALKNLFYTCIILLLCTLGAAAQKCYVSGSNGGLYQVDLRTRKCSYLFSTPVLSDIALDPVSGFLYGVTIEGVLYKIDRHRGQFEWVANLPAVNALAFDNNGVLFAAGSNSIYTIEAKTGAYELATILDADLSDGDLTFAAGRLFLSVKKNILYSINPKNLQKFKALNFDDTASYIGMYGITTVGCKNIYGFVGKSVYRLDMVKQKPPQLVGNLHIGEDITGAASLEETGVLEINHTEQYTLCKNDTLVLNPGFSNAKYLWHNNSTDSTFTVTQAGSYTCYIKYDYCKYYDTFNVAIVEKPELELGPDTTVCPNHTLTLSAFCSGCYYNWNNGSNEPQVVASQEGMYRVRVMAGTCPSAEDSINVSLAPQRISNLDSIIGLCDNETATLKIINQPDSFVWQDGSLADSIIVSASGIYSLKASIDACQYNESVEVVHEYHPKLNLGNDSTYCDSMKIILDPHWQGGTFAWWNGQTDSIMTTDSSGTYWVKASTTYCGSDVDSITLKVAGRPVVPKLGSDTLLCSENGLLIQVDSGFDKVIWSNGEVGNAIDVRDSGAYWATLTRGGCQYHTDTQLVSLVPCSCEVYIPNAFSPNNDGLNDLFITKSACYFKSFSLEIYNRWGQRLFRSTDPHTGFSPEDGQLMAGDVYLVLLKYQLADGQNHEQTSGVVVVK